MSLHLPSQRLLRSATSLATTQSPLCFLTPSIQRRTFLFFPKRTQGKKLPEKKEFNPLSEEYLKRKPAAQERPAPGGLDSSSIFEDEAVAGPKPEEKLTATGASGATARNPAAMAAALDPQPGIRKRWERKMVIREIKKRGRLSKTQALKRQERVLLAKSHDFKTSVKKLVPLAKQIAGKTVEEAIVQMRFSKKKVAKDVREHLEHARNEAIVRRGMGLGIGKGSHFETREIITKDKKRVKVSDPTTLYVDQAWCGKGLWGKEADHRARGQINIMKLRSTSLSLVLKEEKTRIRLHDEKIQKDQKKKVWVQLPNRPITAQRQYYSW